MATTIRVPEQRPELPAFEGGKHLSPCRGSYPAALAVGVDWLALQKARPVMRFEVGTPGDLYSSKPIGEDDTLVSDPWLSTEFDAHVVVRVHYQACVDAKSSGETSDLVAGVYIDAKLYNDDTNALLDHVRWSRANGDLPTGVEWGGQIVDLSPQDLAGVKYPWFQVDTGSGVVAAPGGLPTRANRMLNVDAGSRGANLRMELVFRNARPSLWQAFAHPAREHDQ